MKQLHPWLVNILLGFILVFRLHKRPYIEYIVSYFNKSLLNYVQLIYMCFIKQRCLKNLIRSYFQKLTIVHL